MNVNVNPFSYNSNDTSAYNYKRLDPSAFWNPSFPHYGRRVKKKKQKEESIKKVVRNVKNLPDHLIGRFKHGKESGKKPKAFKNFIKKILGQYLPFSGCSQFWTRRTWSSFEDKVRTSQVNDDWEPGDQVPGE